VFCVLSKADLAGLTTEQRSALVAVWTTRAAAEQGVSSYVRTMMQDLVEAGADGNVLALGARVCDDEDRHARMCLAIASAYAGRSIEAPAARHPHFAPLDGIAQPLRASLRVLGMCCIGETLAAVWMDRSYDATTVSSLRPWVRQHFADEVHHAQLGWAHFASTRVPSGAREAASRWLVPLVQANLNAWLTHDEPTDGGTSPAQDGGPGATPGVRESDGGGCSMSGGGQSMTAVLLGIAGLAFATRRRRSGR
jgi:hypothetical protein